MIIQKASRFTSADTLGHKSYRLTVVISMKSDGDNGLMCSKKLKR